MWKIVSSLDCDTFAETTSCILSFRYYYSLYILHNAHKQAAVTSARGKLEQTVTHILYFKHCNYYNLITASFTKQNTLQSIITDHHFTLHSKFNLMTQIGKLKRDLLVSFPPRRRRNSLKTVVLQMHTRRQVMRRWRFQLNDGLK